MCIRLRAIVCLFTACKYLDSIFLYNLVFDLLCELPTLCGLLNSISTLWQVMLLNICDILSCLHFMHTQLFFIQYVFFFGQVYVCLVFEG